MTLPAVSPKKSPKAASPKAASPKAVSPKTAAVADNADHDDLDVTFKDPEVVREFTEKINV